jgi:hypothetical protein
MDKVVIMKNIKSIITIIFSVTFALSGQSQEIFDAVKNNDSVKVRKLLIKDPEQKDLRDQSGNTPLHYAVLNGSSEIVKLLLANGAYMGTLNFQKENPLQLSLNNDNNNISKLLFESLLSKRSQYLIMGKQWLDNLKRYPDFSNEKIKYPVEVNFFYDDSSESNLKRLRVTYKLDSIAGNCSETGQIINLMTWVFSLIGHANNPDLPKELNAYNLINLAQVEKMEISCYMKTLILNEVYLSMGFKSRRTHLLPHTGEEKESHYITSVYSNTFGKWILMDPDFGVYVTDEIGNILGISEIRKKLIKDEPMVVVNINTVKSKSELLWDNIFEMITGADYLWFLSDFIFKIRCPQNSTFNQDTGFPQNTFFELLPDNYKGDLLQDFKIYSYNRKVYFINNEDLFWQKPK